MLSEIEKRVATKGSIGIVSFLVIIFLLSHFSLNEALPPLAVIVFTIISLTIGRDLIENENHFRLLIAFCIGTLSYTAFHVAAVLSETLKLAEFVLLIFAGGSLMTVVGILLGLLVKLQSLSSVSAILKLFPEKWIQNFSLGALLTLYIAFIRPSLLEFIPLVVIGEWIVTVFIVFVIYVEIKKITLDFYTGPKFSQWQKHTQNVERRTHTDFGYLTRIQDLFVNSGRKELILVYYALQLRAEGESERKILQKIEQLSKYQDKKTPILAFPWTKKKIQKMNKKAREELLKKLVKEIT
jgi:hypothetical protein